MYFITDAYMPPLVAWHTMTRKSQCPSATACHIAKRGPPLWVGGRERERDLWSAYICSIANALIECI